MKQQKKLCEYCHEQLNNTKHECKKQTVKTTSTFWFNINKITNLFSNKSTDNIKQEPYKTNDLNQSGLKPIAKR